MVRRFSPVFRWFLSKRTDTRWLIPIPQRGKFLGTSWIFTSWIRVGKLLNGGWPQTYKFFSSAWNSGCFPANVAGPPFNLSVAKTSSVAGYRNGTGMALDIQRVTVIARDAARINRSLINLSVVARSPTRVERPRPRRTKNIDKSIEKIPIERQARNNRATECKSTNRENERIKNVRTNKQWNANDQTESELNGLISRVTWL